MLTHTKELSEIAGNLVGKVLTNTAVRKTRCCITQCESPSAHRDTTETVVRMLHRYTHSHCGSQIIAQRRTGNSEAVWGMSFVKREDFLAILIVQCRFCKALHPAAC